VEADRVPAAHPEVLHGRLALLLGEEVRIEAEIAADEAERLADSEEVLERIRRSRMQVKYCRLYYMARNTEIDDATYAVACEKFLADVDHFGFVRIREGYTLEDSQQKIRAREFPG
jgi:hypothetical protein